MVAPNRNLTISPYRNEQGEFILKPKKSPEKSHEKKSPERSLESTGKKKKEVETSAVGQGGPNFFLDASAVQDNAT